MKTLLSKKIATKKEKLVGKNIELLKDIPSENN